MIASALFDSSFRVRPSLINHVISPYKTPFLQDFTRQYLLPEPKFDELQCCSNYLIGSTVVYV